ncbi:MAG: hypothetical protein K2Z81_10355, partial [Cyanobacteria bacterium]|nr:hypothetical protein [Cyanobacteriota bacterium]
MYEQLFSNAFPSDESLNDVPQGVRNFSADVWSRPADKQEQEATDTKSKQETSLDVSLRLHPELTKMVLERIARNPVRQEDKLAVEYLMAKDPAARNMAMRKLSELTDENGRMRFLDIQLLDSTITINDSIALLESPRLAQRDRDLAKKSLQDSLAILADRVASNGQGVGVLPGERSSKVDQSQEAILKLLRDVSDRGYGADVQQAQLKTLMDNANDRRLATDALSRFAEPTATKGDRAIALKQISDLKKKSSKNTSTDLLEK